VSTTRRFAFEIFICSLCLGGIIFSRLLIHGGQTEASPEVAGVSSSEPSEAPPEKAGLSLSELEKIEPAVEASIKAGEMPGAVVLAVRHGKTYYLKAFGNRAIKPAKEPMTTDTIFDIASLTKVVATTPAIMHLADKGMLRLDDPVNRHLPRFTGGGKDNITLRHLLTHYSGLRAGFEPSKKWSGYDGALEEIWKDRAVNTPGRSFIYSDLNFIVLAEIVRAVSGKPLDVYARENIFLPLGMTETSFTPPAEWAPRIAPTEMREQGENPMEYKMLRGTVHDMTTWKMGGVSGQAGVFSSARDLAIYAQALLNRGEYGDGGRFLSEAAVTAMTSPQSPPRAVNVRGYGWDIESEYSSPRGSLFSGGFGHTGFTGTSIWVHPPSDSFVIILSNRVHPSGGKNINNLRRAIADIVAASIINPG